MSDREGTAWLRTAAVAARLGVSPSQVQILIRTGLLEAKRHSPSPRGMYLVRESECDRYLADQAPKIDVETAAYSAPCELHPDLTPASSPAVPADAVLVARDTLDPAHAA